MVPTQRQRSTCFGLAIWLTLSRFWWTLTSERSKKRLGFTLISVVIVLTLVSLYTAESVSCSIGQSCLFASAHWANWLFGK
ncbi:MAG: hypothetical protein ACEQSB_02290 [Undibacterium sp.]